MWRLFVGLYLFIGIVNVLNANNTSKTDSLCKEPTSSNIRYFNEEQLNGHKADSEFQYSISQEDQFSLAEYLKIFIVKLLDWLFGGIIETDYNFKIAGVVVQILKVLFWAAAIFLLVYGVLKLMGLNFASLFYKTGDVKPQIQFQTIEEDINEIDFDSSIEEAIANKNYRFAIRLYYLKTLKLLSDKDFIKWQKDKTNTDYVLEVEKTTFSTDFRSITNLFNYSWYGKVLINENSFDTAQQNFVAFFNKLNLNDA